MKAHMRETLMKLTAAALLSNAGIAAAQEAPPAFNATGCRTASDKVYSLYDDQITAGMRFGETYTAVTTQLEGSDENWHLVTLMINCSDNGGSYRTYAWLKNARTVKLYCPHVARHGRAAGGSAPQPHRSGGLDLHPRGQSVRGASSVCLRG
jgi:hypothetical protein